MKIVCSNSVVFAEQAFSSLGQVHLRAPRDISAADVQEASALVTRSTTPINAALLDGSQVQFVGTATIGIDHMDVDYLEQQGIRWTYAPGCNANSIAEYIVSALLCLANRHGFSLEGKTIGVIGGGNVGSRVMAVAEVLGLRILLNDPPRAREEEATPQDERVTYHALDTLLEQSDIVSLHVPLSHHGADPTYHLADAAFFERMKSGGIFINAARGAVVDTGALLKALDRGTVAHAIIDTWENEPDYSEALLDRANLGTPHIAGYSFDGLVNGTTRVYNDACRFFDVAPTWTPGASMPAPDAAQIHVSEGLRNSETVLWEAIQQAYDITSDDRQLREHGMKPERGKAFDRQRRDYAIRREFAASTVHLPPDAAHLEGILTGLGFACKKT